MGLGVLQHYTIEPSDLERTKDFYCDVLGLENGDRPHSISPATGSIQEAPPRCI